MTTVVRFKSAGAAYAIAVGATRAVRPAAGMIPLPAPATDVAGILPGDPPLTVFSPLGIGGAHILVIESEQATFGLLVDSVTGLCRIADADIRLAPGGQKRPLVCGTVDIDGELVMITQASELAGHS
jgi:chemotaxis signal transduction protein